MALIQHPTVERITFDVPDADVDKWTDAGWKTLSDNTDDTPTEVPAPTDTAPADVPPADPPVLTEPIGSDSKPTARTRKAD